MSNETEGLRQWNTMQQVAKYLNLSLRTVERRIKEGYLQASKNGRLVRIKNSWVWDYENRLGLQTNRILN